MGSNATAQSHRLRWRYFLDTLETETCSNVRLRKQSLCMQQVMRCEALKSALVSVLVRVELGFGQVIVCIRVARDWEMNLQ